MENPQRLDESYIPSKGQKIGIIVGMLMGDASIVKKYPRTLVLSTGSKDREYFDFKCRILQSLGFKMNKVRELHTRLKNGKEYLGYIVDFTDDQFEWFYQKYYGGGKRHINPLLLRHLNMPGLAIWYMDDGNLINKKGVMYKGHTENKVFLLNTQAFSYVENEILCKWFKKKFGWDDIRIHRDKQYFKLYFPAKYAKPFFNMIRPYTHKSMEYKLR